MTVDNDNKWLNELPLKSEEIGFTPEQMTACPGCGRQNPPTRASCFYCSFKLEVPEEFAARVKLNLRTLENWEKGFNVVMLPVENENEGAADELSKLLSIEKGAFLQMIRSHKPLPIARVESGNEAEAVIRAFSLHGLECRTVSDVDLDHEKPTARLRWLEFGDGSIILQPFNSVAEVKVSAANLDLIVTGEIFASRIETSEKRKKRKTTTTNESQTSSDEKVIDLYSKDNSVGWRIRSHGFDFSCLGGEKSLLVGENMAKLAAKLKADLPHARFVEDYRQIRELLDHVWAIQFTKDSLGIRRSVFRGNTFGTVVSSDNQIQFTKYSRLQRRLI
jgi:hypothetical protein